MAEPNSIEWMTEQRDRLKAECDAANTRADQLASTIKGVQAIADEVPSLRVRVSELDAACKARKADAERAAEAVKAEQEKRQADARTANEALAAERAAHADTKRALSETQDLAAKRRAALATVMKSVQSTMEAVMPLLSEG